MQNGQTHVYYINMYGKIHQNEIGLIIWYREEREFVESNSRYWVSLYKSLISSALLQIKVLDEQSMGMLSSTSDDRPSLSSSKQS